MNSNQPQQPGINKLAIVDPHSKVILEILDLNDEPVFVMTRGFYERNRDQIDQIIIPPKPPTRPRSTREEPVHYGPVFPDWFTKAIWLLFAFLMGMCVKGFLTQTP